MVFHYFDYILFLILGFSIGVLSGFFGVGGAFILTPALNILGLSMASSIATGLAFTMGTSFLGSIKHYLLKNVLIKISLIIGFFSIFGLRFSYSLVIRLNELSSAGFYIRSIYAILLLSLGILMLQKKEKKDHEMNSAITKKVSWFCALKKLPPQIKITQNTKISFWVLIIIALFVGFLQGIMGVGGGFILIPLFLFIDIKPNLAAGTSLGVIIISSTFGSYYYFFSDLIIPVVVLLLFIGSIIGVHFGTEAIRNINNKKLKQFYGTFLLLISLGVILKQLNLDICSLVYTLLLCFITAFIILSKYYYFNTTASNKENKILGLRKYL